MSQIIVLSSLCKKYYTVCSSQPLQCLQLPAGDVFKDFYKEIIPQDALLNLSHHQESA